MREFVYQINNFEIILIISLLTIFILFLMSDSMRRGNRINVIIPEILTDLVCTQCGLRVKRRFKEGDYISKETDEKCARCGGTLYVNLIYTEEVRKK